VNGLGGSAHLAFVSKRRNNLHFMKNKSALR
jgi:hypothetical protein